MEETSKQSGFLLISSLFILTTMIMIVSFYLSAVLQEVKVAQIVDTAPQAYYLAEAGIQEAFWKLQNDTTYKTNFETDPNWSTSFTRNDSIISGGSYTVAIENQSLANAAVIATSTISIRDTQAQRVVRAGVFKALNSSPITDISMYTNGDLKGTGSAVTVTGGDFFANEDIDLNFFSAWTTDQDAQAVEDADISVSSSLTAANVYDQNNPPIPSQVAMPQIDFDSTDATSYKSLADQTYTSQAFRQLLKDFPVTTLNGITYVTGDVNIKKGHTLTINGILVADGSISIANGFSFESDPAVVDVNKTASEPSGLLSKKNITIGGFNATVDVEGLLYSGGKIRIQDGIFQNVSVAVTGGMIAQDVDVLVAWNPITITHNQTNITEALGTPLFSQILFINHWEEEY
jgi:Tfp pilus assembly protein PilX